jgi:hypothetical protein
VCLCVCESLSVYVLVCACASVCLCLCVCVWLYVTVSLGRWQCVCTCLPGSGWWWVVVLGFSVSSRECSVCVWLCVCEYVWVGRWRMSVCASRGRVCVGREMADVCVCLCVGEYVRSVCANMCGYGGGVCVCTTSSVCLLSTVHTPLSLTRLPTYGCLCDPHRAAMHCTITLCVFLFKEMESQSSSRSSSRSCESAAPLLETKEPHIDADGGNAFSIEVESPLIGCSFSEKTSHLTLKIEQPGLGNYKNLGILIRMGNFSHLCFLCWLSGVCFVHQINRIFILARASCSRVSSPVFSV